MMFWHIYVTDNRILQQPDVRQQAVDLLSACPILRFCRDRGKIVEEPPGMADDQLAYWVPLRLLLSKPGTADRCPSIHWQGASMPLPSAIIPESMLAESEKPLRVEVQRFGRPVLPDFPSLFISISHSGNFTVLSVSDVLNGIDVQEIRPVRPYVAERFFTAADRNMLLSSATDVSRSSLFFRLWTIREAYAKFTGRGLSEGLNTFDVRWMDHTIVPHPSRNRDDPPRLSAYFTELTPPSPGCCMSAVTLLPGMKPELFYFLPMDETVRRSGVMNDLQEP